MDKKKLLRALAILTMGAVASVGCVSLAACTDKAPQDDNEQVEDNTDDNQEAKREYNLSVGMNSGIAIEAYEEVICHLTCTPGTYVLKPVLQNMEGYEYYIGNSTEPAVAGGSGEADDHNITFTVTADMLEADGTLTIRIKSTSDEAYDDASLLGKLIISAASDAGTDDRDEPADDNTGDTSGETGEEGSFEDQGDGNKGNTAHLALGDTEVVLSSSVNAFWQGVEPGTYMIKISCPDLTEEQLTGYTVTIGETTYNFAANFGSVGARVTIEESDCNLDKDGVTLMLTVVFTPPEGLEGTYTLTVNIAAAIIR